MNRRAPLALAALLAALTLSGPARAAASPAPDTPESLKALFLEGRLDAAEAGARRLLAAKPGDPDAHVILANILRQRAMDKRQAGLTALDPEASSREEGALFDEAIRELEAAVAADPSRRDIWLGLCQITGESGRRDALAKAVDRAAAKFPKDEPFAAALRENARPFLEESDYVNAAAVLEAIARSNPESLPTLIAAGRAAYLAGRRPEGIALVDSAVSLRPNDPEAHAQRADIAALEGDFPGAASHFARAANLDPFRYSAWLGNAACLHVFDTASALRSVRTAQNRFLNPQQNRTMQDTLALSIIDDMRHVLEVPGPSSMDILRIARVMASAEYNAAAVAELTVLLKRDRGMVEAHALMAQIRSRLGQKTLAAQEMREALDSIERQPDRTFGVTKDEVLTALGAALADEGEWAESTEAYRKTSDPSLFAWEIGRNLDRQGKYSEAAKLFQKVIQSQADPDKVTDARRKLSSPAYRSVQ
jgi:tetratricopeptide (TPR) repeat protein